MARALGAKANIISSTPCSLCCVAKRVGDNIIIVLIPPVYFYRFGVVLVGVVDRRSSSPLGAEFRVELVRFWFVK
jgi:hypothetical protein